MKKFFNSIVWLIVSWAITTNLTNPHNSGFGQFVFWSSAVYVFCLMFESANGDSNMGGWMRLFRQFDYLVNSGKEAVLTQPELDMPITGVMIYHSPAYKVILPATETSPETKFLNKSRCTIVARYDAATNEICFAAARCSKNEQFCRRIGRNIAIQRLDAGECIQSVKVQGDDSPQFTFLAIAKNLATWLENNPKPVA